MATKQKSCIVQICMTIVRIFHNRAKYLPRQLAGEGRSENSTVATAIVYRYERPGL